MNPHTDGYGVPGSCFGLFLESNIILTTASCATPLWPTSKFKSLTGVAAYDPKQNNWEVIPSKIKRSKSDVIIPHLDYNAYSDDNNIAIVKFASSINQMVKITPFSSDMFYIFDISAECIVTDWSNATHTQRTRVSYIPQEECRSRLSSPADLTEYV